ncbi:hypothetical protein OF83DRAFT_1122920 [Amylostereum chailletii]|nr:hypothetical protein OF83DRAFT_1122920 [Amylostereum chailletii]
MLPPASVSAEAVLSEGKFRRRLLQRSLRFPQSHSARDRSLKASSPTYIVYAPDSRPPSEFLQHFWRTNSVCISRATCISAQLPFRQSKPRRIGAGVCICVVPALQPPTAFSSLSTAKAIVFRPRDTALGSTSLSIHLLTVVFSVIHIARCTQSEHPYSPTGYVRCSVYMGPARAPHHDTLMPIYTFLHNPRKVCFVGPQGGFP